MNPNLINNLGDGLKNIGSNLFKTFIYDKETQIPFPQGLIGKSITASRFPYNSPERQQVEQDLAMTGVMGLSVPLQAVGKKQIPMPKVDFGDWDTAVDIYKQSQGSVRDIHKAIDTIVSEAKRQLNPSIFDKYRNNIDILINKTQKLIKKEEFGKDIVKNVNKPQIEPEWIKLIQTPYEKLSLEDKLKKFEIDKAIERGIREIKKKK